tara:strand:+ start:370 stop:807 length:438 start_codon:yes stop_codon:yes gene_type:complete
LIKVPPKIKVPVVIRALIIALCCCACEPPSAAHATDNDSLYQAWQQQLSNIQLSGSGIVTKILRDDVKGSRHQRFILKVNAQQTILVAHNIDLAPRIPNLREGDTVEFYGEYEWNAKGGVLHWTHKAPHNRHPHGWLRHQDKQYW